MKSSYWITILLIALVTSNAYWMMLSLDSGITQTYQESSLELAHKMYEQTLRLANLELTGLGADEALTKIGKDVYGLDPFEKEGCIYAGNVCVRLNEDRKVVGIDGDSL